MKIAITGFSGANKALHPRLVPEEAGVLATNQRPGFGDFRPWRQPLEVATVPAARASIYRFGRDTRSDSQYWFSWNTRVHAIRGYNGEDTTERTYFTGSGAPKWVDNTFAVAGGGPYPFATRNLGVPAPATQAVVTSNADGVAENTESRYYTYTYVNSKGDEGAPAPVSLELVCKTDDTVAISALAAPPGGFDIVTIRVYVTVTGEQGATEFHFLREFGSGSSSTTDDLRERGEVLATDGWLPPPADLSCLTPMWNGMAAAISGMGVRVCPPYAPYAWPIAFEYLPPDAKPVGLGVFGQNLLVLTTAKPARIFGTSPDSLDLEPLEGQSCSSEPGIVSFPHGVAWPCEDGLAYFGLGGGKLLTGGLISRDEWQAMNPDTMVAGVYEGAYLCFFTDAGGIRRGFFIDPLNPTGVFFLDDGYEALFWDQLQDALYVLDGPSGSVRKWDAGVALMTATYRSKLYTTPPVNFTWARVQSDAYPVTLKIDAGPFTAPQLTTLVATNPAILAAAGTMLRATLTAVSAEPFKLPSGFKARDWQAQGESNNAFQMIVLATDVRETT